MSRLLLPLTAGALAGATAYHVLTTQSDSDFQSFTRALNGMRQDLDSSLPQDSRESNPAGRAQGDRSGSYVSYYLRSIKLPDFERRSRELKSNWNRVVSEAIDKITGTF